jgi:hypothetical protein
MEYSDTYEYESQMDVVELFELTELEAKFADMIKAKEQAYYE